jgi:cold shock CspA family protein
MTFGTVVDFDDHRGSGTLRDGDGRELAFHCTSLADGSRLIDPGTAVVFAVVAGHHGRWEAAEVRRLDRGRDCSAYSGEPEAPEQGAPGSLVCGPLR